MKDASKEDYLKAIYHLGKEESKNTKSIEISKYLKVSKPTVSEMLRKLADNNLVKFKAYGSASLTKKGLKVAKLITYKHRIIENFLTEILGIEKESIAKIHSLLKNPRFCPHGKPIPDVELGERK